MTVPPGVFSTSAVQVRKNAEGRRRANVDHAALAYADIDGFRRYDLDIRRLALEARRLELDRIEAERADRRVQERLEFDRERHRDLVGTDRLQQANSFELQKLQILAGAGQLDKVSFLNARRGTITWENDPMKKASER